MEVTMKLAYERRHGAQRRRTQKKENNPAAVARRVAVKERLEQQLKDGHKPYKPNVDYPDSTEFIKASGEERIIGVKLSTKDAARIMKEIDILSKRV